MKVDEFCGKQPRERGNFVCVVFVLFSFAAGNGMEAAASVICIAVALYRQRKREAKVEESLSLIK